ncbi:hypothetical protein MSPP1_003230 [Malassezia sp. CBS 17886]|nr:hypothetical protein MSPP1_003230 [Malassezia sp. CBS 17886]
MHTSAHLGVLDAPGSGAARRGGGCNRVALPHCALVVVDMQRDFIDGSLVRNISRLITRSDWGIVVATQDAHPQDHVSFAATHKVAPFHAIRIAHPIQMPDACHAPVTIEQMMWPVHCVRGTPGAEIDDVVQRALREKEAGGTPVFYVGKGQDPRIDSYSAFAATDYTAFTKLAEILFRSQTHGEHITTVVVCGLATDYCVRSTAVDAAKFGFRTLLSGDYARLWLLRFPLARRAPRGHGCREG